MAVHQEVLAAVRRLCREARRRTFRPGDIVLALPHLNASSVRTHIVSRCCVNAPANHPHRWPYFRRVARGTYEVLPPFRRDPATARAGGGRRASRRNTARGAASVAESVGAYATDTPVSSRRDTVHAVVTRSKGWYVAECLEIVVVTQARTLDELVANLRDAVALHLEGESGAVTGVVASPRISLTYDIRPRAA